MIAEKWDISRDDMEAFAVESPPARPHGHRPRAASSGEIVPLGRSTADEGPREPNSEKIALAARRWSRAAASPPPCPARSATPRPPCWSPREQALKDHGLTPRARIHHLSVRGDDPICMLTAPIPATRHALPRPA